jgi:hypothetical protein
MLILFALVPMEEFRKERIFGLYLAGSSHLKAKALWLSHTELTGLLSSD